MYSADVTNEGLAAACEASSLQPKWYVIQCRPREDERAFDHLTRQNFECFYAERRVERRYPSGRRYFATEAFFPGYVFVRLDRVQDNWSVIRSTRGVNRIVRFGEDPTPVPAGVVEDIRARLCVSTPKPYLKPGENVQINDGAFAAVDAIFLAPDGDDRVVVLLRMLQQEQKMTFPIQSVRKAG